MDLDSVIKEVRRTEMAADLPMTLELDSALVQARILLVSS
jgi:hypothetical protein